jgi:predicted phosphodiesterase
MKIQLASDLHLEFLRNLDPNERLIEPAEDADILVLSGDIASGSKALSLFKDWPTPVIFVAGNHEYYGRGIEETQKAMRDGAEAAGIHYLENQNVIIGGVRFLGATLWTDYRLNKEMTQSLQMKYAGDCLNDHRSIYYKNEIFTTRDALDIHEVSRAWLKDELAKPFEGKTVVVTHHGPHPLSTHPRYVNEPLNAAFVSDLSELLEGADLWLHGHVHDSFSYQIGRCRVVANPAGYITNLSWLHSFNDCKFENPGFNRRLIVEV